MSQSLGVIGESAWEDERARAPWRRDRRMGRVWLVLSAAFLAAFFVIVIRQQDHADWLVQHGVRVTGVVLDDPPQAIRCGQVPVPVRFNGAVHKYYVDGCGGGGLSKGETVTVRFNPANRDDFIINGNANERPLPTLTAIVGLVAGSILLTVRPCVACDSAA